ncbi:uncharacterized protein LOC126888266 [Diabrotica virgifera virgifera]|uniref:Uncharacterized protein LOC114324316 n=1 Tax=Diabrotica virgifera virgifera TaxID=50390 RepID=A0A6P7F7R5_DIAVI|nr:uncharacterized protein LOC114325803 [Diabrotica virgifera virgifera]XP_050498558.1 uncharacterized protein LOC126879519 [Diabrotica virgifera virgifera]XP_050511616.1 uncharacterized protein LOC126887814 [Diabrotica virgifera virgifera]XP_050512331.1 uncharacterized protein LOC126888266 [Diabrotica virgifera virgifera]
METKQNRNSLIMKLTKKNVEIHNIDKPMWAIQKFLKESEDHLSLKECIQDVNKADAEQQAILESCVVSSLNTTENRTMGETSEKTYTELSTLQDNEYNVNQYDLFPSSVSQTSNHNEKDVITASKCETNLIEIEDNQMVECQVTNPSTSSVPAVTQPSNHDCSRSSSSSSVLSSSSVSSHFSSSEPFGSGKSDIDPEYDVSADVASDSSDSGDENDTAKLVVNRKEDQTVLLEKQKEDDSTKQRGRKRTFNEANWKKNVTRRLRNSGKSYTSVKIAKLADGTKIKTQITRDAKKVLQPCTEKCRLKCKEKIMEEQRLVIFNEYWNLADLQRQRDFIASSLSPVAKSKYSIAKRSLNNAYYFHVLERKHRVCKTFFMSTLGITSRTIRTVCEKQKQKQTHGIIANEARGKHKKHKTRDHDILQAIMVHIQSIPRVESHYCRARTQKEYIEGTRTIAELYRDYKELCENKKVQCATYRTYYDVFTKQFNIDFYFPKKDQCDLCLEFRNASEQAKELIRHRYETHLQEKDLSRIERENDKKTGKYIVTFDLQATLPCPTGNASSFYYISKLNTYNLTFASFPDKDVSCYVWHEGEAKRGANEIGSCIWHFLNEINQKGINDSKMIDIIFYTDNCTGQNKNRFLFGLYSFAVHTLSNINVITHKYLIRGHTQNDADNVHSVIERQITRYKKAAAIYVPEQYITLIRQAKKTGQPYKVHEFSHDDFLDIKDLTASMGMKEIYKTSNGENVKISDIKVFEVRKDTPANFFCKISYAEDNFLNINMLCRRSNWNLQNLHFKKLYNRKLEISDKKKQGIISLMEKNIIPSFYHTFYLNL